MIISSICKVFILRRDLKQTEPILTERMEPKIRPFFPDVTAPSFIFRSLEHVVDKKTNASEALRTPGLFLCIIFKDFTQALKK